MDQDRTYLLLAKYIAGEATAEEREELEWAFLADPELRKLAEQLPDIKQVSPKGLTPDEERSMLERGLERIRREEGAAPLRSLPVVRRLGDAEAVPPAELAEGSMAAQMAAAAAGSMAGPLRKGRRVWWVAAASVFVLVAGAALFLHSGPNAGRSAQVAMLTAGRGARKFAKLPDGTQLWLNAGSRIVLAQGFSHDQRELTLEGEAFFDVKHDEQHPFIIHTGAYEVRVLGTALNVRAYPGESSMETTLIEGKAEVGLAGNPQSAILLHPNEKVIFPREGENYERRPIVPDRTDGTIAETSWTKNKLVFRNETLADMSARLERWYNVTIVFDDKRYQQDTISGTFPDMPIDEVMHALRITSGFQYKIEKDTVHIW